MRQTFAIGSLTGTALMVMATFGIGYFGSMGAGFAQATTPATTEAPETFDANSVDTFSGAYLSGRTANADRDFDTAITLYKKALAIEPGNIEIRQSVMLALFMNGQFDEGVKYAHELKSDPAVERVTSIALGLDAIRNREYTSAEKLLAYKGPNDLDRLTNSLLIAWAKMGAGQGKEALAMIDGLEGPEWYAIFKNYNAGAMAAAIGDVDAARTYFANAVTDQEGGATAPDTFLRSVFALAVLEAGQGNKQKAYDAIATGDTLINNYAPFKALRERIEKGNVPQQQVTNAQEGAAAVLFAIGGALNREGAQDTVTLYLQLAHALDHNSADTLILLGGLAENAKQTDRAIAFYGKVPATSPMRRISELQLGLALAQTGKVDDARKHLKSLITSDPSDIRSYLAYGSVLSDAKDYVEMADNYDRAVDVIGPTPARSHWSVFFQRGIAYERLKKWDIAEPSFRKALELNPDQPQVLNYLGYSWVDMNRNLDEGLDMIRKAVELRPDDGYIVDSLGWAYFRLGRFDEAVDELERAVQLKAGDATINDHLGDAYWRVGRKLEAVYQWKRALISEPEKDTIPKIEAKIAEGLPPLEAGAGTGNAEAAPTAGGAKPQAQATDDKKS